MQIVLNLPQDIAEGLTSKWADLPARPSRPWRWRAIRSGALTHAQLRRLLGFGSRGDVDAFLKQHGVYLEYTLDDVERDTESSRLVKQVIVVAGRF